MVGVWVPGHGVLVVNIQDCIVLQEEIELFAMEGGYIDVERVRAKIALSQYEAQRGEAADDRTAVLQVSPQTVRVFDVEEKERSLVGVQDVAAVFAQSPACVTDSEDGGKVAAVGDLVNDLRR